MTQAKSSHRQRVALAWTAAAAALVMLGMSLPGHLTYDSMMQLHEGRVHVRETWGPIVYSALLGFFDGLLPGAALYVTASAVLLFGSLASMGWLRPKAGWLAPVVLALLALTPQLLIYQGIVWKDVAFANLSVAGLVLLAHAGRLWARRPARWALLFGALVLLAIATQVRQNGIVTPVLGAVALGWIAARAGPQHRWRRGVTWGVSGLLVVVMTGAALTKLAMPSDAPPEAGVGPGLQIVATYDLLGAVALDRNYRLARLARVDAPLEAMIHERAPLTYSGRRMDLIDKDPVLRDTLNNLDGQVIIDQWRDLITQRPDLYLRVRWEDYRWLIAPPVIDWCLPISLGVNGAPADLMRRLNLDVRWTGSDRALYNYTTWMLDTPVFAHLVYAAISLVLAGLFLWRRDTTDLAMAALQLAGVGFAASFFIITIACDYRYLYFTDLAAMAGLVYAAVDPPWRRKKPV